MAGNSAIWRATSLGAEANNSGDIVEFNGGSAPDGNSNIINTQFVLLSSISTNERPKIANDIVQDLGFSQLGVIVTGSIKKAFNSGSDSPSATKFRRWLFEDKTNTSFPYGRFGLRLDDIKTFDLVPSATYGYLLHEATIIRDAEYNRLNFILKLRFNGNVSGFT